MQPSPADIDNAIVEEAEAMREFAEASKANTKSTLKVTAARKRLMLARQAKNALVQDMFAY